MKGIKEDWKDEYAIAFGMKEVDDYTLERREKEAKDAIEMWKSTKPKIVKDRSFLLKLRQLFIPTVELSMPECSRDYLGDTGLSTMSGNPIYRFKVVGDKYYFIGGAWCDFPGS